MDASKSNGLTSEYTGTQPAPGVTRLLDRLPASELQPRNLFDQFVKARLPAVISGLPSSDKEQWKVHLWTDDYLMKKAGSCKVLVQDWNETEATEEAIEINYDKLISNLVAGDTRYNLISIDTPVSITELDSEDDDFLQSTVVDPLPMLADDFPRRPPVFGNLVVRRIALCQGISNVQCGVSSGLKHDSHDKFSLLLHGRQRFRLFPPSVASRVLGTDCPIKFYPNGLIVRLPKRSKKSSAEVHVGVRADGAPYEAIIRQKRDKADKNLSRAEQKLYHLRRSGTSQRSELEKAMDLVNECENVLDGANEELHRFDIDSEEDCTDQSDDDVISIHDDDSDPDLTEEPAPKIRKLTDFEDSMLWEDKTNGENGDTLNSRPDICLSAEDTDVPEELFAQCPEFRDIPCILVDLLPGEMLYLPASWFYEVTTYDNVSDESPVQNKVSLSSEDTRSTDIQVSSNQGQELVSGEEKKDSDIQVSSNQGQELVSGEEKKDSDIQASSNQGQELVSGEEKKNSDIQASSNQGQELVSGEEKKDSEILASSNHKPVLASSKDNQCDPMSTSSSLLDNTNSVAESRSGHLSLEYWTFPPDGDQFEQPYMDQFWPRRWAKFEKERERIHRRTKLISSDVISLNSESSDSSSSVSSDEENAEEEFDDADKNGQLPLGVENEDEESNEDCLSEESLGEEINEDGGAILVGDDSDIESDDINEEIVDDSDSDVVDLDAVQNGELSTSSVLVADEDISISCDLESGQKDADLRSVHDVEQSASCVITADEDVVSGALDESGLGLGHRDADLDNPDDVDDVLDDELLLNSSSDSESHQPIAKLEAVKENSVNSNQVDSTSKEEEGPILIALS